MKGLIKIPLILAAVIIVVRIGLEEVGAPGAVTNILGVNWLYLLVPIYFAFAIAGGGDPHPYKQLLKTQFVFVFLSRLMILVTYVLAYPLGWSAVRFSVAGGGGVGHESALQGMVLIPLFGLVVGTIIGTIIGMIIGSITLAIKRRMAPASA